MIFQARKNATSFCQQIGHVYAQDIDLVPHGKLVFKLYTFEKVLSLLTMIEIVRNCCFFWLQIYSGVLTYDHCDVLS